MTMRKLNGYLKGLQEDFNKNGVVDKEFVLAHYIYDALKRYNQWYNERVMNTIDHSTLEETMFLCGIRYAEFLTSRTDDPDYIVAYDRQRYIREKLGLNTDKFYEYCKNLGLN